MKVSPQFAKSHLDELLSAADSGEEVDIDRSGKTTVRLTVVSAPATTVKRGLWGAGKGEIWMADDWDSSKTNEEIARLFNDGPIFPAAH